MTDGLYRYVRHPMYSAFFLWALAQALLLPNWFAGPAGLVGFGTLFFFRVGQEEQLMLETFGEQYRAYMQRTARHHPENLLGLWPVRPNSGTFRVQKCPPIWRGFPATPPNIGYAF